MALHLRHISHDYALTRVLRNVNLDVFPGQTLALVGPSGCGKTTLLQIVAGLIHATEGRMVSDFRGIGCVFQQPRLLPWKPLLDNIALGLKALRVPREVRMQRASALARQLGLKEADFGKFPHELSGGMQSRAALARALVIAPDLLLLDEPFSALDIGLKIELYQLLRTHIKARRTATMMITHDLMEAVYLADQIAVMSPAPGQILRILALDAPPAQRDEAWVYRTCAEFMQTQEVRDSFGLPGAEPSRVPVPVPREGCQA